jgi:hypothetical protein
MIQKGQAKDEDNKSKTQYKCMLDTIMRKQTQIT